MEHAEALSLIAPYADGELDVVTAAKLEAHLSTCADCAARLERLKANRDVFRDALDAGPAPESLRARIVRSTSGGTGRRARASSWVQRAGSAAAALVLVAVLSSGATFVVMRQQEAVRSAQGLLDAYMRAQEPGRLVDVASSDKHTVKPWLDARLDFAPPVEDLAAQGFPLIGGRLDYVNGRRAAVLVYGRRKHVIDVFVEPATRGAKPSRIERRGFTVLTWRARGFDWQAVSDVGPDELAELRRLISVGGAGVR
jgi:anti-sigma factor RsiW